MSIKTVLKVLLLVMAFVSFGCVAYAPYGPYDNGYYDGAPYGYYGPSFFYDYHRPDSDDYHHHGYRGGDERFERHHENGYGSEGPKYFPNPRFRNEAP